MRPLVLLHGFAGHADSWRELISSTPRRSTVAYTLLGHDSNEENAPPSESFNAEIERLAARVRSDFREKVRLCGYSMGGRIALMLLLRHPELFSSAVLIGASPGLESEAERVTRAADDQKWIELISERGIEAFVDAWAMQPIFASQQTLVNDVSSEQRRIRRRHRAEGLIAAMRILGLANMPNVWPELHTIELPVDLVVGELDTKFRAIAERMHREIPSSRIHAVAGCGHNVVLENPTALAALLSSE